MQYHNRYYFILIFLLVLIEQMQSRNMSRKSVAKHQMYLTCIYLAGLIVPDHVKLFRWH
jgi:hypothetical protein